MGTLGRELRRGTLELVLLHLVGERPMYGYELVTELDERSAGRLDVKEGTVYPVLYRLEAQGLVEAAWQQRDRGVPRKYYSLTRDGTSRLGALLQEWTDFSGAVTELLVDRPAAGRQRKGNEE